MPEEEDWQKLANVILHWNSNRLDLFEISQPSKSFEFQGVMRFSLEDRTTGNFATKCLRVCSSSTTREVIDTLLEKFRPDMKMLSTPYCLYEVHSGKERKLDLREKPLVVQLHWNTDNREGCFVLRNEQDILLEANCHERKEKGGMIQNFKRTLSRKEKKKKERSTDADLNTKTEGQSSGKEYSEDRKLGHREHSAGETYLQSLRPNKSTQNGDQLENTDKLQLPLGVKFRDNSEDSFLSAVINYTNSSTIHFKLSPAYVLYMAGRYELQRHGRSDSPSSPEQAHKVSSLVNKMVNLTESVIQKQQVMAGALAFWMANISELLNFIKLDKDLSLVTQQAQDALAHLVHKAFKSLVDCLQMDLKKHMTGFLIDPEREDQLPGIEGVVNTLTATMSLLRRSRVNPALTIQLFSQLLHFISAWLFNRLLGVEASTLGLRSHYWGAALRQRLTAIEDWAERQGLELAADCHLGRILQATMLLTMNKYSMQDAKEIQKATFKLNSLQLKKLMNSYLYATNEPLIPPGLIDSVVAQAKVSADELLHCEGRDLELEESLDLQLPFLLPDGGYSCETIQGIPHGFREFLEPICRKGLCTLISLPHSNGLWTVFFAGASTPSSGSTNLPVGRDPEVVILTLKKPLNSGMGVSIVAAKGAGHGNLGIYVKSIVKGGPAEMDGRLSAGDQLLSVDGQTLVGISQERAAGIMMKTGPVVTLQVAKLGACFHGLDALLYQPPSKKTMDGSHQSISTPNEKSPVRNIGVDLSISGLWGGQHGASRRRKEQLLLKNRQLYRSNPNMIALVSDEGEPADPVEMRGQISAVSTHDICSDESLREYQTLPALRSQDRKAPAKHERQLQSPRVTFSPLEEHIPDRRAYMRHAHSQDNLCVETVAPLVEKPQGQARGRMSHQASVPVRSCISTHDLHLKLPPAARHHQSNRQSGSGYWRTPAIQNPVTSIQPIRIDIPATRPIDTRPPLTTFRQNTTLLTMRLSQSSNGDEKTQLINQGMSFQNHAGPSSPNQTLPQASVKSQPLQQQPSIYQEQQTRAPTVFFPPRQTSPHKPSPQQQPGVISPNQQNLYSDLHRELSGCSGLSPDPWKRAAREALEKQQRLQVVALLERELRELQAKDQHTPEEKDRLRRVGLEWQFQKRLQEFQQNGEDDDEEEDKDVRMIMQQLEVEDKTQLQGKDPCKLQQHIDENTNPSREDKKITSSGTDQGYNGSDKLDLHTRKPEE
ncbi:afadin [Osmerus eperlanus]|uniref:afadin n=1 Tax=Osmerus eperlanus TaxID=29151 RepID=UPI002E11C98F